MITAPIWQDTYYTLNDTIGDGLDPFVYTIAKVRDGSEEEIFKGKAYQRPGDTFIRININKICQNYLTNTIQPLLENGTMSSYTCNDAQHDFRLYDNNGLIETYRFTYDWSYGRYPSSALTATDRHYDARMYKLAPSGVGTTVKNYTAKYGTVGCGDYALYYLASDGNFYAFLIEGICRKKRETITRNSISTNFNNNTLDFEERNFQNQYATTYELHTGWLNKQQSEVVFFDILPSTAIYLHDLIEDRIVPVTITDNSVDFKSFMVDKTPATYTINVKESQSKIII